MKSNVQKEFKVILERDEDGYFVADVPALPGCHAQGKTMAELQKNIREVITLCLAEAKKNESYRRRIREFSYEPSFVGIDTVRV